MRPVFVTIITMLLAQNLYPASLVIKRPFEIYAEDFSDFGYCKVGVPNNFRHKDWDSDYLHNDARRQYVLVVSYQPNYSATDERKFEESATDYFVNTFGVKSERGDININRLVVQPAEVYASMDKVRGQLGENVTGFLGVQGSGAVISFDVLATAYLPAHFQAPWQVKSIRRHVATIPLKVTAQMIDDPSYTTVPRGLVNFFSPKPRLTFDDLNRKMRNNCPYEMNLTEDDIEKLNKNLELEN